MGYTTDFHGTFTITPPLTPKLREEMQNFSEKRHEGHPIGYWCNWEPNEEGTELRWNEAEKFYNYIDWLELLIKDFLVPNGHTLNGLMKWNGEDAEDLGCIIVRDNHVNVRHGEIIYVSSHKDQPSVEAEWIKSLDDDQIKEELHKLKNQCQALELEIGIRKVKKS